MTTRTRVKYLRSSCTRKKGDFATLSTSIAKVLARRGVVEIVGSKAQPNPKSRKSPICMSEL